jgi:hypothetical protein
MKTRHFVTLSTLPLVMGACTSDADNPPRSAAASAATPAAEAIGPALDCLPLTQFNNSRIRDDRTIDFIGGAGNKVWRVTLPNRCAGLKAANAFTYETSLSQLCKLDIIYPLNQFGNTLQRGPGCGLAPFVPVKLTQ